MNLTSLEVLDNTAACAQTTIGTPYYLSPEICQVRNGLPPIWLQRDSIGFFGVKSERHSGFGMCEQTVLVELCTKYSIYTSRTCLVDKERTLQSCSDATSSALFLSFPRSSPHSELISDLHREFTITLNPCSALPLSSEAENQLILISSQSCWERSAFSLPIPACSCRQLGGGFRSDRTHGRVTCGRSDASSMNAAA